MKNNLSVKINQYLDLLAKRSPLAVVAVAVLCAAILAYGIYVSVLQSFVQSNDAARQIIKQKRGENDKDELLLNEQPLFEGEFKRAVNLYVKAQPLLPNETEIAQVLEQMQETARRNSVVLAGLNAAKDRTPSQLAQNLFDREMPAVVTGKYDDVARFFYEVSNLQRILLIRDFSVVSVKDRVSANFSLIAFQSPAPKELPPLPASLQPLLDSLKKSEDQN